MRTELDISGDISVVKRERGRRVPRGRSGFMAASGEIDPSGFGSLAFKYSFRIPRRMLSFAGTLGHNTISVH